MKMANAFWGALAAAGTASNLRNATVATHLAEQRALIKSRAHTMQCSCGKLRAADELLCCNMCGESAAIRRQASGIHKNCVFTSRTVRGRLLCKSCALEHARPCACGKLVLASECVRCTVCERMVCRDCTSHCQVCTEPVHAGCHDTCSLCGYDLCIECTVERGWDKMCSACAESSEASQSE